PDGGNTLMRQQLPTRASLLDVTVCPDGRFAAIDARRNAWVSEDGGENWQERPTGTEESPMAIACDPQGRLWVTASYSTLLLSEDLGASWDEISQDEDMQLSAIQFLDASTAFVVGEFGTLLASRDAGENWERIEGLPEDFYPLTVYFESPEHGWVAGLNGTVLHTQDGGASWERQETSTAAPLYRLTRHAGVTFVAGDNGTLLRLDGDRWSPVPGTPQVLSYLIATVANGRGGLLVAGGQGTLDVMPMPVVHDRGVARDGVTVATTQVADTGWTDGGRKQP
ncbi:MAG: YCF48-related protein, partial [Chromatiales bacterium]|nr:YCF48-related protein [Chromatiales bacterium]